MEKKDVDSKCLQEYKRRRLREQHVRSSGKNP